MKAMKKILIPIVLVSGEILFTWLSSALTDTPFFSTNTFFIWGMLFFFLSMGLIFGTENRYNLQMPTNSENSVYSHNVANYIGSISKNFFTRTRDLETGNVILCISVINLLVYFVLILWG